MGVLHRLLNSPSSKRTLLGPAAVLATVAAAVACSSILGLEDRTLDTEPFPKGGYEGCTPDEDCDGCTTEEHFDACEGNSTDDDDDGDDSADDTDDDGADDDSAECTPDNGCQDCPDCFEQCICSGDSFSVCQEACGNEAPSEACTPDSDCQACDNCFAECVCQGGLFQGCVLECEQGCAPDNACAGCESCVDECRCEGQSAQECDEQCRPTVDPPVDDDMPPDDMPPDEVIDCDGTECQPFDDGEVILAACCPPPPPGAAGTAGALACGLNPRAALPNAPACLPVNSPRPPDDSGPLLLCDREVLEPPPYNGATLEPCCTPMNECGLWDNVTGLGCVPQRFFGVTQRACSGDTSVP